LITIEQTCYIFKHLCWMLFSERETLMARIPESEVERLKREVSLERLVEARGIELKKHGADLIGRCPFHDDRTPSLVVSPGKNLWHCLGACGTGGSVIDWVMKVEGVSFRHAVEMLRVGAGLSEELPRERDGRKVAKTSTVRKLAAPVESQAGDAKLLEQVVSYYHATLKDSPEGLGYLEGRGLRSAELVERFRLGFANRTLGYRLPQKNRQAGAELRGRLQALGVCGRAVTSTSTGLWWCQSSARPARWCRCTGGRSRPRCARARHFISICPGRTEGCGTWRR